MKYGFPMILAVACERVWLKIYHIYAKLRTLCLCWIWGVDAGKNVLFLGKIRIRTRHRGEIVIGDNVILNSHSCENLVGLVGETILDTRYGGRIVIGRNSGGSSVVISSKSSIRIGEHVKIGGNVRIFDHDFHAIESERRRPPEDRSAIRTQPISIGDDVFIGTNAIILKGTTIGNRSIVSAGSVVSKLTVQNDSLVAGNPAIVKGRK